jgi:hypothetical protein
MKLVCSEARLNETQHRIWYDHKQDSRGNADFRIGSGLPLSHCFSEVINTLISRASVALLVLVASNNYSILIFPLV